MNIPHRPKNASDFDHWQTARTRLKTKLPRHQAAAAYAAQTAMGEADRDAVIEATTGNFGSPLPPLIDVQDEARWWVQLASQKELKAYCALSFLQMTRQDRRAFLKWAKANG